MNLRARDVPNESLLCTGFLIRCRLRVRYRISAIQRKHLHLRRKGKGWVDGLGRRSCCRRSFLRGICRGDRRPYAAGHTEKESSGRGLQHVETRYAGGETLLLVHVQFVKYEAA